jgi:3-isopropylmalate/(R)-2-methylmalate dehydratase small subunit
MDPISQIRSKTVVLPAEDVDTDQIIPARFLTTTTKDGLGKSLFADWRYHADGTKRSGFSLDAPEAFGASILVAGRNFGCGSSREHAPWALVDFGIRVVISTEIADIFRNNALKNGLIPVIVNEGDHQWLIEHPGVELTVDLESSSVILPDQRRIEFPIEGFSRYCLMNGLDQLGYLLENADAIRAFEQRSV